MNCDYDKVQGVVNSSHYGWVVSFNNSGPYFVRKKVANLFFCFPKPSQVIHLDIKCPKEIVSKPETNKGDKQ